MASTVRTSTAPTDVRAVIRRSDVESTGTDTRRSPTEDEASTSYTAPSSGTTTSTAPVEACATTDCGGALNSSRTSPTLVAARTCSVFSAVSWIRPADVVALTAPLPPSTRIRPVLLLSTSSTSSGTVTR